MIGRKQRERRINNYANYFVRKREAMSDKLIRDEICSGNT